METTPESPIIALARFVAGTMNEGCDCDTCAERKELVTRLVMNRHSLDELVLDQAVAGTLPERGES
jgi:hypothetical protein